LVREARLRAGLTQAELGRRVGAAPSAIGRWERGDVSPSFETLRSLIRATGHELSIGIARADDHDVALIRRSLKREPNQRLEDLVRVVRTLQRMAAARG
jgi:transcriptional regulator with XRE-family HTH domain